jgi:hypothetical protein
MFLSALRWSSRLQPYAQREARRLAHVHTRGVLAIAAPPQPQLRSLRSAPPEAPTFRDLALRRPDLAHSLREYGRVQRRLALPPDKRAHTQHLLFEAARRERVQGLNDWLQHIKCTKLGKRTPTPQQANDVYRTFHEIGEAVRLHDLLPPPYRVRVGCDKTRRAGRGFDLQVEDADGKVCANIEVTSRSAPVRRATDLLSAIHHIVAKIPGAKGGSCGGAIAMRWDADTDAFGVIGDMTAALNRGEGPWYLAAHCLDSIELFCNEPGEEKIFARMARGPNGWAVECGPFAAGSLRPVP